jgi:hypothetical protein
MYERMDGSNELHCTGLAGRQAGRYCNTKTMKINRAMIFAESRVWIF